MFLNTLNKNQPPPKSQISNALPKGETDKSNSNQILNSVNNIYQNQVYKGESFM